MQFLCSDAVAGTGRQCKVARPGSTENLKPLKDGVLEYTLNPRSVLILRAEGEQRIEPVRYEAEWAYLPCFNDLGKSPKTAAYTPIQGASGGMGISHIGGSMENHALWSVYSEKAVNI